MWVNSDCDEAERVRILAHETAGLRAAAETVHRVAAAVLADLDHADSGETAA